MAESLLPAQEQLLDQLVEASQRLPRPQQRFTMYRAIDHQGEDVVTAPGGFEIPVLREDIGQLEQVGYISGQWNYIEDVPIPFVITKEGFDSYATRHEPSGSGADRVQAEVRSYLDGEGFKQRYPDAYARWSDAEAMLWQKTPKDDLTTVGHKCREAMQRFATALVERYGIDAEPDPARTINRMRAVIDHNRDQLGDRRRGLLGALSDYWVAVDGLVQRQEHGDQKGNEPVTWEDARLVVFQTAVVMYELDRTCR
jgi:hypothetical protein